MEVLHTHIATLYLKLLQNKFFNALHVDLLTLVLENAHFKTCLII